VLFRSTFDGIRLVLSQLCGVSPHTLHPRDIIFIDDRSVRHKLIENVPHGLTYIKPISFVGQTTERQKQKLFRMALEAMETHGLLRDREYLRSPLCHRLVGTMHGTRILIRGFPELFQAVWHDMEEQKAAAVSVQSERGQIRRTLQKALADREDNRK
jgi:hypothetical protein